MTRAEIEAELDALRPRIARLQAREADLVAWLARLDGAGAAAPPRPGWPIARAAQDSGERISTSSKSRTAV